MEVETWSEDLWLWKRVSKSKYMDLGEGWMTQIQTMILGGGEISERYVGGVQITSLIGIEGVEQEKGIHLYFGLIYGQRMILLKIHTLDYS